MPDSIRNSQHIIGAVATPASPTSAPEGKTKALDAKTSSVATAVFSAVSEFFSNLSFVAKAIARPMRFVSSSHGNDSKIGKLSGVSQKVLFNAQKNAQAYRNIAGGGFQTILTKANNLSLELQNKKALGEDFDGQEYEWMKKDFLQDCAQVLESGKGFEQNQKLTKEQKSHLSSMLEHVKSLKAAGENDALDEANLEAAKKWVVLPAKSSYPAKNMTPIPLRKDVDLDDDEEDEREPVAPKNHQRTSLHSSTEAAAPQAIKHGSALPGLETIPQGLSPLDKFHAIQKSMPELQKYVNILKNTMQELHGESNPKRIQSHLDSVDNNRSNLPQMLLAKCEELASYKELASNENISPNNKKRVKASFNQVSAFQKEIETLILQLHKIEKGAPPKPRANPEVSPEERFRSLQKVVPEIKIEVEVMKNTIKELQNERDPQKMRQRLDDINSRKDNFLEALLAKCEKFASHGDLSSSTYLSPNNRDRFKESLKEVAALQKEVETAILQLHKMAKRPT